MPHLSFKVKLYTGGTPAAVVGGAMERYRTDVSGYDYIRITDETKRVIDSNVAVVIKKDGAAITPTSINYIFGYVTVPTEEDVVYTIDYTYIPLSEFSDVTEHSINCNTEEIDVTTYANALLTKRKQYSSGYSEVQVSVSGLYRQDTEGFIEDNVTDNKEVFFEYRPAVDSYPIKRGWFIFTGADTNGSIFDRENVSYNGKISGLNKESADGNNAKKWGVLYSWT